MKDILGMMTPQWQSSYLETVADSENGDTEVKDTGIDTGGIVIVDGVRASRENDTCVRP
jgi:hypothetical protein